MFSNSEDFFTLFSGDGRRCVGRSLQQRSWRRNCVQLVERRSWTEEKRTSQRICSQRKRSSRRVQVCLSLLILLTFRLFKKCLLHTEKKHLCVNNMIFIRFIMITSLLVKLGINQLNRIKDLFNITLISKVKGFIY